MNQRNPLGLPPTDAAPRAWFRIENRVQNAAETSADVYIYDAIGGWWGVEASSFVAELAALDVDRINLFVNSPGGDVYDAVAMTNAIRRHRAHVVATVDGLAASAASFLITAADEIVMSPNSELMIHDAWGIAIGNAGDMRDTASRLDAISDNIASMYARQAGTGEVADWRDLMLAETWYSADEAVAAGLADRVDGEDAADASNLFDLTAFAHAGRRAAPEPLAPAAIATARRRAVDELHLSPEAASERISAAMLSRRNERPAAPDDTTPTHNTETEVARMDDVIIQGIMNRLGIPADSDGPTVLAALDEALAERAEPTAGAPALPEGVVAIDSATLDALRGDAAAGRDARNQQDATRRADIVTRAVNEGRIPPARAEHWAAQLAADEEGATATLNSLEAGTIPLAAKGYSGGVDESGDDDTLYMKVFGGASASTTNTTKEA